LLNAYNPNMLYPRLPYRWLVFFARLFADLSAPGPDFDALARRYWNRVCAIYDRLPRHVDPRPRAATTRLINHFGGGPDAESPLDGT
jgi:hypothetical protein